MLGKVWTGSGRGELYCEVTPSGVNPLWVEPDLEWGASLIKFTAIDRGFCSIALHFHFNKRHCVQLCSNNEDCRSECRADG